MMGWMGSYGLDELEAEAAFEDSDAAIDLCDLARANFEFALIEGGEFFAGVLRVSLEDLSGAGEVAVDLTAGFLMGAEFCFPDFNLGGLG
jgi:hypothetical protein